MKNTNHPSDLNNSKNFYDKQAGANLKYIHLNSTLLKDIYPIDIGYEKHTVKNVFTNKYPYYLLHFVKSGKGQIEIDGILTDLPKNTLFILPPDKTITYHTHPNWEYYWINFNGTAIKNILNQSGITDYPYKQSFPNNSPLQWFRKALVQETNKISQIFTVTSCLLAILALIVKQTSPDTLPVKTSPTNFDEIYNYIHVHLYDIDLSAKKTAEHFFISECYFSTLFKKNANSSLKEYINYERVKKATQLLETTDMVIKQISNAVGFLDPLYFSKVFKRYRLVSPQQYRFSIKNKR